MSSDTFKFLLYHQQGVNKQYFVNSWFHISYPTKVMNEKFKFIITQHFNSNIKCLTIVVPSFCHSVYNSVVAQVAVLLYVLCYADTGLSDTYPWKVRANWQVGSYERSYRYENTDKSSCGKLSYMCYGFMCKNHSCLQLKLFFIVSIFHPIRIAFSLNIWKLQIL